MCNVIVSKYDSKVINSLIYSFILKLVAFCLITLATALQSVTNRQKAEIEIIEAQTIKEKHTHLNMLTSMLQN